MTHKARYVSFDMETALAASLGKVLRRGSKRFFAHDVWQTTEHSMGVMLMLRKPCLLSDLVVSFRYRLVYYRLPIGLYPEAVRV
jgi:hypothetical protein